MNVSETKPVDRKVPAAGSVQRSWPWHLFVALVLVGAALLVTHYFFKPAMSLSLPSLSFRTGGCRAEFEAVNNTDRPATAVVQVNFGLLAGESGVPRELARTEVPVALTARQRKSCPCDFSPREPGSFLPNTVRAEIISYRPQLHDSTN